MKAYAIIQKDPLRPVLHGKDGTWCYWNNLQPNQKREFLRRYSWQRVDAVENALQKMRKEHPGFYLDSCMFDI